MFHTISNKLKWNSNNKVTRIFIYAARQDLRHKN